MKLLGVFIASVFGSSVVDNLEAGKSENIDGVFSAEDREMLRDSSIDDQLVALGKLFHKIDEDSNGSLNETELTAFARNIEDKYIKRECSIWFGHYDSNEDGFIGKDEFDTNIKTHDDWHKDDYLLMKQKFSASDFNGDGKVDIVEFEAFQFPRYDLRTKHLWLTEMVYHFDQNNDGKVVFDEFLAYSGEKIEDFDEKELQERRDHFSEFDENKDGSLSRSEIKEMIDPTDESVFEVTAKHLMYFADTDKSLSVDKAEFLANYDIVLDSQISDHGKMYHDEL